MLSTPTDAELCGSIHIEGLQIAGSQTVQMALTPNMFNADATGVLVLALQSATFTDSSGHKVTIGANYALYSTSTMSESSLKGREIVEFHETGAVLYAKLNVRGQATRLMRRIV